MPVTIKLSKSDSSVPWGFRLHGGKDFGAPLTVQRINPGSIAARCGLEIGDNISAIDSCPTTGLKHKEAQDLIVKAGNNIQLSVCRGDEIPVRQLDVSENFTTGTFRTGESTLNSDNSMASQVESLSIGDTYKTRLPSYSSGPASYKAPPAPTISSKNASLYQPSLQNITSGLTKSAEDPNQDNFDDFPPPPPSLPPPSPSNFSAVSSGRPHQPMHRFPDVTVTEETSSSTKSLEPGKYVPSETYRLVKDLEAGVSVPFNPRTGAGVKSSPIQSKLVDILEKKHATLETERMQDNQVKRSTSPQPSYYGPKNSNYGVTIGGAARNREVQKTQKSAEPNNWINPEPPSFARAPSPQPSSKGSVLEKLDPSAIPICNVCNAPVRGAYIMAINKIFCPEHFVCGQPGCKANLSDAGFVEEQGQVYCKDDYERYFAPKCAKCNRGIIGNTVKALKCTYHPECFTCAQCNQAIMGGSFHLHEGQIYCDKDFSVLFSAKCLGCNFPIEVGDNWIEAVGTNWHGECFNCSVCQVNLQNSGFVHKNGRFLCRDHAR